MMKEKLNKFVTRFVLVLSLLFVNNIASAMTLAELQKNDKVRIKIWIEPKENIISRQQLNLQIEVSTDKWFSSGTKIGHFEIKDAIVLQREKFALNSTRTQGDKNWTVQQWTLVVYPQRPGHFDIPPIPLDLSIAGDNLQSIEGRIMTEPVSLEVGIPDEMRDKQHWIATSVFEIEESYNQSLEEFNAGDALIRTIRLSAESMSAMMLPITNIEEIPGIAVYRDTPQLIDHVNRGVYLAERVETLTYVFEQAGEFELPEIIFHWWNMETDNAEFIALPAKTLVVASATSFGNQQAMVEAAQNYTLKDMLPMFYRLAATAGFLLLVWWLIRLWFKRYHGKHECSAPKSEITESQLLKEIKKACSEGEYTNALNGFYRWLNDYADEIDGKTIHARLETLGDSDLVNTYDQTMKASYSREASKDIEQCDVFMRIISSIKQRKKQSSHWAIELKLN